MMIWLSNKCATVALHAGRYFAETSYFHSFGRKPNLALLNFAVLSRISRDLNFGRDNMNAAKQAASQGAKHRNASWINPSVYPYIAAVSGAVAFGVYSVTRHVAGDPDLGKAQDINNLDQKAADTYRESPLRKAITGEK